MCKSAGEAEKKIDAWIGDYLVEILKDTDITSIEVRSPREIHTDRDYDKQETVYWGTVRFSEIRDSATFSSPLSYAESIWGNP